MRAERRLRTRWNRDEIEVEKAFLLCRRCGRVHICEKEVKKLSSPESCWDVSPRAVFPHERGVLLGKLGIVGPVVAEGREHAAKMSHGRARHFGEPAERGVVIVVGRVEDLPASRLAFVERADAVDGRVDVDDPGPPGNRPHLSDWHLSVVMARRG